MTINKNSGGPRFTFSLRVKITIAFFIISSIVSGSLSLATYQILKSNLFKELQNRVKNLTTIGSLTLNTDALKRLTEGLAPDLSDREIDRAERSSDYLLISDELNRIRDTEARLVRYVYTFVPTDDENTALFVVDADVLELRRLKAAGEDPDEEEFSHLGSVFDIAEFETAKEVLRNKIPLVENEYSYDETFMVNSITGYAPVFDADGHTLISVLGIDMVDTDVRLVLINVTRLSLLITIVAVVLSLAASIGMGALFTKGIIKLDKIVRYFDQTHLDVRSNIKSGDEVGRLGTSFNQMADTIQDYSVQLEALLGAFRRFVPHDFIKFLDKKSILDVRLGDQVQKEMTIMFSDIRSFSELSESMTPEQNFNFLNSYLSRVGPEIRAHNGFIDKYIGDSIMALFPGEPEDALRSSISMFGKLGEYNGHRQSIGYKPISIGIGIHTGKLMLGTLGEHERMDGSVIADAVNLCSRIESLTRIYGASILLSGYTLELLPDKNRYNYRFVDKVQVKGRKETTVIFEVFDVDSEANKQKKRTASDTWNSAIAKYYDRQFNEAFKILSNLKKEYPDDILYDIFIRRCENHIKNGVPDDWQGIEVLLMK